MKRLKRRLQRWVFRFLELDRIVAGIDRALGDVAECGAELRKIKKTLKEIINEAIIGVDLGYRDESQVIIIQYSRLTNGFKVVADTNSRFETYRRFIDEMRGFVTKFNARTVIIDAHSGVSKADLVARILPDKTITDMYKERL